jgi:transcriptional regulator with XRE-family HTH domain
VRERQLAIQIKPLSHRHKTLLVRVATRRCSCASPADRPPATGAPILSPGETHAPANCGAPGHRVWTATRAPHSMKIVKLTMAKRTPNPVDKHVGSRIRMCRLMLGMSQEKLAGGLGVTFQQVQKYENGRNRVGAGRLQQISHILQVPLPFFFEGSPHGGAPSPAYVSDFLATADGLALIRAFMRIKEPTLRQRLVELVEEIAADDLSALPV